MGDQDRKGINMIPEISMHMSKGVIKKKKNGEKNRLRLGSINVQMQPTALKLVTELQQAATGRGELSQGDSYPEMKTLAATDYGFY